MTVYITNALSLNMIKRPEDASPVFLRLLPMGAHDVAPEVEGQEWVSAIGHPDLAAVVADVTGLDVQANRINVELTPDDYLIVAQYRGPRLEPGTTMLPVGATIEFWAVELWPPPDDRPKEIPF